MKPKILMILHLPPPVHGAAVMGKYLIESTTINEAFEVDHINLSTSTSLTEIGKGSMQKLKASLAVLSQVTRALRRKKYDLCYVTLTSSASGFYKDLLVVLAIKLAARRIIYHFHNKGVSSMQSRWVDNLLYRFAFRGTKSILLSPALYADVRKYVKTQDIFFCPNGIPANFATINSLDNISAGSESCRILFLSHMMVQKGVVILLDACKILKDSGFHFECHFVGAWMDITNERFNDMVEQRGIKEFIFAHGPKFGQEKSLFYNQTDVFVFPTLNECFGLVLLEAMSFSLPVVATGEGAIPDIVKDQETGFIVEKNNARDLAEKLKILISHPELRQQFGTKGKLRFKEHFTIDRFEANMTQIFKSTMQAGLS